ncbi:unnamed protein product [Phytophthora lilii]|uniref:Unnamed protein product n=1 Tax=Phytophthora lilii TaxID=2077276 RepID=A0A9W6X5H3_9STRA|nr:unnamed protein product [Phytophthora lilii]
MVPVKHCGSTLYVCFAWQICIAAWHVHPVLVFRFAVSCLPVFSAPRTATDACSTEVCHEWLCIFLQGCSDETINLWRSQARHLHDWSPSTLHNPFWAAQNLNGEDVLAGDDTSDEAPLIDDEGRLEEFVPDDESRNMTRSLNQFPLVPTPSKPAVATEDDAVFYGFGWIHQVAMRSNRVTIEMNKGDILLYRGDFIIAPVAYTTNNVCIHAYLDTPFSHRDQDHHLQVVQEVINNHFVDDDFCFVYNCTFYGRHVAIRRHMNRYHGIRFQRLPRSATA